LLLFSDLIQLCNQSAKFSETSPKLQIFKMGSAFLHLLNGHNPTALTASIQQCDKLNLSPMGFFSLFRR